MINDTYYIVEELALQYNVLRRWDNNRVYMHMNNLLYTDIVNITRSAMLWDSFVFSVDADTPVGMYSRLRNDLTVYVKAHPGNFGG